MIWTQLHITHQELVIPKKKNTSRVGYKRKNSLAQIDILYFYFSNF